MTFICHPDLLFCHPYIFQVSNFCHPELVSGSWSCNCHPPRPVTLNLFQGLAHRKPLSHLTFGTVYVLCAKLTACHLRTSHTLCAHLRLLSAVALSSLGLRFAPVGISRRCARLSYVAIVVHGPCSPQAPIAPVLFSPINKHIPS